MRIAFSISIDNRKMAQCQDAMDALRLNRSAYFSRAGVELAERTLKAAPRPRPRPAQKGKVRNG